MHFVGLVALAAGDRATSSLRPTLTCCGQSTCIISKVRQLNNFSDDAECEVRGSGLIR